MCECKNCNNCDKKDDGLTISRRKAMAWSIGVINLAVFGAVFGPVLGFLGSPLRARSKKEWVSVCGLDDLEPGKTKEVTYVVRVKDGYTMADHRYALYLKRDGDEVVAIDPACTHLGCKVQYQEKQARYLCPCHGGVFDTEGNVVSGPPPKALIRHAVEVRDGQVFVQRNA